MCTVSQQKKTHMQIKNWFLQVTWLFTVMYQNVNSLYQDVSDRSMVDFQMIPCIYCCVLVKISMCIHEYVCTHMYCMARANVQTEAMISMRYAHLWMCPQSAAGHLASIGAYEAHLLTWQGASPPTSNDVITDLCPHPHQWRGTLLCNSWTLVLLHTICHKVVRHWIYN